MVDLMDVLIERTPMKCTMRPVMPGVLQHKEDSNLVSVEFLVFNDLGSQWGHLVRGIIQHCEERREWYAGREPDVLSHWVKEPRTMSVRSMSSSTHWEWDEWDIPYLRQLNGEMRKQNQLSTFPLFFYCWNPLLKTVSVVGRPGMDGQDQVAYILDFVFVEVWDAVYNCPWN